RADMPQNTPNRGYTYPLYTDPADEFPQQIQELAMDFDTDIQNLADTITAAYNKPAVSVAANLINQNVPNTTNTAASFAGGTVHYNNAGIFDPGISTNTFYINETGIYLMTARCTFLANGNPGSRHLTIETLNNGTGTRTGAQNRKTINGNSSVATAVALSCLMQCNAGCQIRLQMYQWSGAATQSSTRVVSIAKVGNI